MGYGLIWATKWILSSLILKKNIIGDAYNLSKVRTSDIPEGFSKLKWIIYMFSSNAKYALQGFDNKIVFVVSVFAVLIIIAVLFHTNDWKGKGPVITLYLALALIPIAWYLALLNHSGIHAYFTYRSLIVFFAGIMMCLTSIIDFNQIKHNRNK